jgi:hypothetical protein
LGHQAGERPAADTGLAKLLGQWRVSQICGRLIGFQSEPLFFVPAGAVIPEPPQRSAIPVGKLKKLLAQVPDDHGLVPSQVYDFFVVDKDGHNKGYISTSGELH